MSARDGKGRIGRNVIRRSRRHEQVLSCSPSSGKLCLFNIRKPNGNGTRDADKSESGWCTASSQRAHDQGVTYLIAHMDLNRSSSTTRNWHVIWEHDNAPSGLQAVRLKNG